MISELILWFRELSVYDISLLVTDRLRIHLQKVAKWNSSDCSREGQPIASSESPVNEGVGSTCGRRAWAALRRQGRVLAGAKYPTDSGGSNRVLMKLVQYAVDM